MSRPRSARAASPAPARGAGAARGVYVPSAKNDIYTALLGVALAAMVIGCILLILVLNRYGFQTKVSATRPAPASQTALAGISEKLVSVRL